MRSDKKREVAEARVNDMVAMRLARCTLRVIGAKHGITRERVRQLLSKTGQKFSRGIGKNISVRVELICEYCQRKYIVTQIQASRRRFCSTPCWAAYKEKYAACKTFDDRKMYARRKAKEWAQKVKRDHPEEWKKLIGLRNKGIRGYSIHDIISETKS